MRRIFLFCLVIVLLVGFSSIGYSQEKKAPLAKWPTSKYFEKYTPPITVTAVRRLWVGVTEADMKNNLWNKYYREKLGINLEYKWAVIGEQYDQKINLMLASGELPDMMAVNLRQLYQLAEAGLIQDLKPAWDTYASPDTKLSATADGTAPFDMVTIDGKLYGIPSITPVTETGHVLFVREDWRKKLGLPEPKTMNDLLKIIEAFTKDDPDGDGKNDTFGLIISRDLYTNGFDITSFCNGYHAYPNAWIKKGTEIVYGSIQPEMKKALTQLQKLYKDGVLDREFVVKDENKASESVIKEQAGVFFGVQWAHWIGGAGVDLWLKNPQSKWKVYPIPSIDNRPAKPIVYNRTNEFFVVRKGFEHPEALIKMLNLINLMGHGPQPLSYDEWEKLWNDWGYAFIRPETIHNNIKRWMNTFKAIETNDPKVIQTIYKNYLNASQYEGAKKFFEFGGPDGDKWRLDPNVKQADREWAKTWWGFTLSGRVFQILESQKKKGLLMYDQIGAFVSPTMIEKLATLEKLETETFTRIITGDAPIEEFDKFVEQWNKLGGDQITKELNEWHKKTFKK